MLHVWAFHRECRYPRPQPCVATTCSRVRSRAGTPNSAPCRSARRSFPSLSNSSTTSSRTEFSFLLRLPTRTRLGEWEAHRDDYEGLKEEDDEAEEPEVPAFPALEAAVDAAIARLGGAVLPKLNWSCPKDVGWLSATGTPKCSNAQEVFLLLKASDSLTYDLCHAFDSCVDSPESDRAEAPSVAGDSEPGSRSNGGASVAAETDEKQQEASRADAINDSAGAEPQQKQQVEEMEERECVQQSRPSEFVLALRKWFDLRPEMEFRCFVKAHQLIGICQREITSFYPFLVDSHQDLKLQICDFYSNSIHGRFPSSHYTFDIYITRDGRVKLVDFNTYGGATLPLLFSWEELEDIYSEKSTMHHQSSSIATVSSAQDQLHNDKPCCWPSKIVEMRIVESRSGVQVGLRAASGAPFDLHDRSEGSAFDELMEKLKVECSTDQDDSSDDEDDC
ncbi:hypothetical protein CLOM_g1143 [Closterium sp. NIES-68]|nr:hypothetical protein CLOM_g1143 [Closterium sp. NIES-68]